jgi:hypothetical protein
MLLIAPTLLMQPKPDEVVSILLTLTTQMLTSRIERLQVGLREWTT